jgi:outer membrane biosynthesis protein TonB
MDMRVPQVSERIKEAPVQALRGVMAGVGQLLLITDKLRNKNAKATSQDVPQPRDAGPEAPKAGPAEPATPEPTETPEPTAAAEAQTPKPKTAGRTKQRNLDKTGNVRLLADREKAAEHANGAAEAGEAKVTAVAAADAAAAADATAGAGGGELALANYDELTVGSIRARMVKLTGGQLGQLIAYEKAHAARAEVLTMLERRLAKLEAES